MKIFKKKKLLCFLFLFFTFIPFISVKALTGYDNNIYPDLPNDGHTTSHYVILKSTEDDIALIYYPNSLITTYNNNDNYVSVGFGDRFNFGGWYTSGYSRKVYLYLLDKDNNVWKYRGYDDYGVGNATLLSSINSDIANNLDVFDSYIYQDIVYSNVNFYATYGNNNASIYNHEKSYMYYKTKTLDNSYAFIFTTNNYNSNYKYQIKFNGNSWLDISKALSNNGHSHTIKENGTLHMQILNENNDVIFSRSILITSFKSNKPLIKANFDNNNYYDDNLNITPNYSTTSTEFSKKTYYTGDTSLYLKGSSSSNLQYNVNLDSTFDLTFYYYKNDSSSYSRLLYLGGLDREVEVKSSSKYMYITKEITTNWKQNEWNKFRVTRDENNLISYYSNDELIFTETSSTVISYIRFGYGSSSSSNLFNGFIDDISLYNKIYDSKEEEIIPISEKKSFSYNNSEMSNPIRYIDLYFDQEDLQKEINFELKLEDYFNYSSCSYCEYLNIDKFEFSYLTKDENGLYKWNNLSNVGNYVDYDGEKFPRNEDGTGFVLTGRINLAYDTSLYDFEKIRVSIKLSNAYNFKYTYSDNSNITTENIDEYYHYMMYNTEHLNRIEGGSTKYTVLTTTKEEIKSALVVQYVNTDKWLYAEYFDTLNHTYLENSALYQDHYIFSDKEIGKATFTIGKNNSRGLYLMNYLYQRDNKNLNSKYYFYIFDDISYSNTDYLDEAPFYDNEGNFNTGVTSNPNYESDNLHFIDNFRSIFKFLEELKVTSNTFNYMWNSFYNVMPQIVQAFLIFATHILCILIFMKIVGYE